MVLRTPAMPRSGESLGSAVGRGFALPGRHSPLEILLSFLSFPFILSGGPKSCVTEEPCCAGVERSSSVQHLGNPGQRRSRALRWRREAPGLLEVEAWSYTLHQELPEAAAPPSRSTQIGKLSAAVTSVSPSEQPQSRAVNVGKSPPETGSAEWILAPVLGIRWHLSCCCC